MLVSLSYLLPRRRVRTFGLYREHRTLSFSFSLSFNFPLLPCSCSANERRRYQRDDEQFGAASVETYHTLRSADAAGQTVIQNHIPHTRRRRQFEPRHRRLKPYFPGKNASQRTHARRVSGSPGACSRASVDTLAPSLDHL